jgi:hypothetical protein
MRPITIRRLVETIEGQSMWLVDGRPEPEWLTTRPRSLTYAIRHQMVLVAVEYVEFTNIIEVTQPGKTPTRVTERGFKRTGQSSVISIPAGSVMQYFGQKETNVFGFIPECERDDKKFQLTFHKGRTLTLGSDDTRVMHRISFRGYHYVAA